MIRSDESYIKLSEVKRRMETIVNIPASQLYLPIDRVIMDQLRSRYVGYCEAGCLVRDVARILRRSDVRMAKSRLDGSGDVSVMFQVVGYVLNPGDVLVGCRVVNISNDMIVCSHPQATVTISNYGLAVRVHKDILLVVEVSDAKYDRGRSTITVTGNIYMPKINTQVFLTQIPSSAPRTPELLMALQITVNQLIEAHAAYDDPNMPADVKKRRDYFRSMYYLLDAYLPADALPKGVRVLRPVELAQRLLGQTEGGDRAPLVDTRNPQSMCLVSHMILDLSRGEILQVDSAQIEQTESGYQGPPFLQFDHTQPTVVPMNLIQLLDHLMVREIRFLRMLTGMAYCFREANVFDEHETLWRHLGRHASAEKVRKLIKK